MADFEFTYRKKDDLLKTAVIELEINEGQLDYARQLMHTGLWGNDVWAVFGECINRTLRREARNGRLRTVHLQLRRR